MPHGSYSLGETAAKQKMVRLVCDKCGRRGQYRIDRLLEQYGPDIAMPDLRHELAQYPHRRDMSNPVRSSTLIDWRIGGIRLNSRNERHCCGNSRMSSDAVQSQPVSRVIELINPILSAGTAVPDARPED